MPQQFSLINVSIPNKCLLSDIYVSGTILGPGDGVLEIKD